MAAGFRTRKIKTEASIGDKLKRARIRKKISVSQVEEETKIRAKFILALESDSWEQIPAETYGRGYLEAYSQFLQLPTATIMKQFARERDLYSRKCQESQVDLAPRSRIDISRFLLTPRFFASVFGVLALMVGGGLITYQIKAFSSAPFLEIVAPTSVKAAENTELAVSAESVNVSGRTAIGASVQVNGKIVRVDSVGNFHETVSVQKGTNAVVVEATNSQGKKTSEVLSVVAK